MHVKCNMKMSRWQTGIQREQIQKAPSCPLGMATGAFVQRVYLPVKLNNDRAPGMGCGGAAMAARGSVRLSANGWNVLFWSNDEL